MLTDGGCQVSDYAAKGTCLYTPCGCRLQRGAMVGCSDRVNTNTFVPQVVQARMWAQGLTIGILIAAGALTHARRAKMYEEGNGMRHTVRLSIR